MNRHGVIIAVVSLLLILPALGCGSQVRPSLEALEDIIGDFISSSDFPLRFEEAGVAELVTDSNRSQWLDDILSSTAFVRTEDGAFAGVITLDEAQQAGQVSDIQREGFKNVVLASLLEVGDWVAEVTWSEDSELTITTLAIVAEDGTPKYEPMVYYAPPELQEITSSMSTVTGSTTITVETQTIWKNGFGLDAITADVTVIVRTTDGCAIADQTVLASFDTIPGFEGKATKQESHLGSPGAPGSGCGQAETKKAVVTIVWASGFKRVSGSVAADGLSAGLEVEGGHGGSGRHQQEIVVGADGSASIDGEPVGE